MQSINLMPPGYARKERAKRRLVLGVGIVVAAILAMLGLAKLMDKRVSDKKQASAVLQEQVDDLKAKRADLALCYAKLRGLGDKLSVVRTLEHNRRWASYLGRIAQAANSEIVLTRANILSMRPKTDDSGSAKPDTKKTPQPPRAGVAPGTTQEPEEDLSKTERLVLLLEGYALSSTDVPPFVDALQRTGLFEKITFKGTRAAEIHSKTLSRFELECPIRYEPEKQTDTDVPAAAPHAPAGTALLTHAGTADKGGTP